MLQVKVNRRNYNFLRRYLYHMIKIIMLRIYSPVKIDAIKMYVIIYIT